MRLACWWSWTEGWWENREVIGVINGVVVVVVGGRGGEINQTLSAVKCEEQAGSQVRGCLPPPPL